MLVSLDPGNTTGICTFNIDYIATYNLQLFRYPHPHSILFDYLSELKPKLIIYEQFHHRQGQLGADFTGVEYIGVIELWAQVNSIKIEKISPGTGKGGFWKGKEKIKALGLWNPSAYPHGMDALRIMLTHLMKHGHYDRLVRELEVLRKVENENS